MTILYISLWRKSHTNLSYSSRHIFIILFCWENLNSSFREFQVYSSVLSMIITQLYIRFSDLYSTYNWEFVPFTNNFAFPTLPSGFGNHPLSCSLFLWIWLFLPSSLLPSLPYFLLFLFCFVLFSVFLSASFFLLNSPFKW